MTPLARRKTAFLPALAGFILLISCSSLPDEPTEVYTSRRQAQSLMSQGHQRTDALEFVLARTSYEAALSIYGSLDYRQGTTEALLALGRNSRLSGSDGTAQEFYEHALAIAEAAGEPDLIQDSLNHQADLALRRGDPVAAGELLADPVDDEGMPLPSVTQGRIRAAQLRLMGNVHYELGEVAQAAALMEEAVVIARAAAERGEEAQACYKLASMASLDARFDEAESWALQALEADKAEEFGPGIAADLRALAIISAKAGNQEAAEDYYRRSWLAWRGLGRDMDAARARTELENLTGRSVGILP